jgi:hypothetical protein
MVYKTLKHRSTGEYGALSSMRVVSTGKVPVLMSKEVSWKEIRQAGFEGIENWRIVGILVKELYPLVK